MNPIRNLLAVTLAVAAPLAALAQTTPNWPSKPIRLIAPYAPGGGPERVIRTISDGLSKRLGQPVIIEYKPGAGGNIGFADLARSAPDGHSWLIGPDTTWTINPAIYKNVGFKTSEVVPTNLVSSLIFVLACHPSTQVKSAQDVVQRAKAQPMSFASSGAGSPAHVTMELMMERAGFRMTHVPYRGPAPAVQDLIGGQVDCAFLPASTVQEHVRAGRLLGVATSTRERVSTMPQIATLQEQGFKDFEVNFYVAMFGHRAVPADVQARFQKALDETIRTPEVNEAFSANGNKPEGTTPEAAQKELQRVSAQWQSVLKRLNLALD
ncbi:tripartite tricarboxylate transporter substrate binding protein [Ramlibacter sp. AW1]|uniref:Tripartite tricarboxylate transporter substrate binding protein n=1 Tax=Ramlibacter aurantiacus TaxID=2801330 RepID=A0A936ZT77_9BURK|nr:tripartite tricarboxylate transporter substrate binding protein [Ramlibacter aurantiacus]MBL0420179.1 tripartite tricarboxylate transporter substrate binding protein [Ramlibacter aurantiacus]